MEMLSVTLRTVLRPEIETLNIFHIAYLCHLCCLLSSSPGPSWNPLPDFLCWAAAAVAAVAGCPPARTARSPPWSPLLQPGPGRWWSLALWSPSSCRRVTVSMRHSKNVSPGREVLAFSWRETRRQRGREGGRLRARLQVQLRQITHCKAKQYRKLRNQDFKTNVFLSLGKCYANISISFI